MSGVRRLDAGEVLVLEVAAGERLRLELAEGPVSVSLFACHAADHDERLSMYTSQSVNHSWQLGAGALLMGTDSRELWTLLDLGPATTPTYAGGGGCDPLLRAEPEPEPEGEPAAAATCADLLAGSLAPHGLGARQLGPDAHFHPFAEPTYDPEGPWHVVPAGASGASLTLRAEQPQLVALLVCPHGTPAGAVDVELLATEGA